jgi:hypothetical protein
MFDRVEILAVAAAGSAGTGSVESANVLRAYFAARRARAARRFLCCAVPVITMVLVGAQAAAGLLAHGAVLAQMAISGGVAAGAAVAEWRATRTFHALVRTGRSAAPPLPS